MYKSVTLDKFSANSAHVVADDKLGPSEHRILDMCEKKLESIENTNVSELEPVFTDTLKDGHTVAVAEVDAMGTLVAIVGGVPVGVFYYGTNYVRQEHRGRGIGEALVTAAHENDRLALSHFSSSGKRARVAAHRRMIEREFEFGSVPPAKDVEGHVDLERRFSLVRQPDGITCGPTALAMAAEWYGIRPVPTVETLAKIMGVDALTGTTDVRMQKGLDALGIPWSRELESTGVPGLKRALGRDGRTVVLLRTLSLGKHWVLAYAATRLGVMVACPSLGAKFWSDEICDRYWGARDYHSFMVKK